MRNERLKRTEELALAKMKEWGLTPETGWTFRFNRRIREAGLCVWYSQGKGGRIELSRHLVELNDEDVILDTILHEIAHALAGPDAGHGPLWRETCRLTGAVPEASCTKTVMPRGNWIAVCPECGTTYRRHAKPRSDKRYLCSRRRENGDSCSPGEPLEFLLRRVPSARSRSYG